MSKGTPVAPAAGASLAGLSAGPWLVVLPIALITAIPVLVVLSALADPDQEIWNHLWQYVLPELLVNTFWLVLGVGLGVTLLGVSLAWLTAACHYPGRRFFSWALLLPLALPAYVTASVWLGLFDFSGPLATWLRDAYGIMTPPPIRSRGGVILVMTLALYPYVYLTARAAFQGDDIEAVAAVAEEVRSRVYVVGVLESLHYLAKGGRVPKVAAWASSLLQVKPIIQYWGGDVGLLERVRTQPRALARLLAIMEQRLDHGQPLHVSVLHAAALAIAQELAKKVRERFQPQELFIAPFTQVLAAHTGPGLVGLAFYSGP